MSRITIVSNDKNVRSDIQKEVDDFPDNSEISFIISFITKKFGCDAELGFPRTKGGPRYVYCYFTE